MWDHPRSSTPPPENDLPRFARGKTCTPEKSGEVFFGEVVLGVHGILGVLVFSGCMAFSGFGISGELVVFGVLLISFFFFFFCNNNNNNINNNNNNDMNNNNNNNNNNINNNNNSNNPADILVASQRTF